MSGHISSPKPRFSFSGRRRSGCLVGFFPAACLWDPSASRFLPEKMGNLSWIWWFFWFFMIKDGFKMFRFGFTLYLMCFTSVSSFKHVVQTFGQSLSEVVESMNQPVTWRPGEAEFSWNLIQISAAWDDSAENNIIHFRTLCWWLAIILQLSEHIIKLEYAI